MNPPTLFTHPVFQRLLRQPGFTALQPALLTALSAAPDPQRSLVNLERFAENYGPQLPLALQSNPRAIEVLCAVFSTSQFLTEILLRSPQSLETLLDRQQLTWRKTLEQYASESQALCLSALSPAEALRRYHQAELLRIGVCDFLALYDLPAVVSQLSRLAIGLLRTALDAACRETGISADGFCVLALGKLGGRELNYSSDIDLLFLSREDNPAVISLAQKLIHLLTANSGAGFLYRVDMRLRPWGSEGPLVSSLPAYLRYLTQTARLWEKQALLKARPVAGELALGETLRQTAAPLLFSANPQELRQHIAAMKDRTEEVLREKGRTWGEVKLGVGSIRDVEFVVQYLQLAHVHRLPGIRTRATLKALPRLRAAGLLTPAETRSLMDGYIFLRTIEHSLQILDYRQTYSLPSDPAALHLLARRLGFEDAASFLQRYEEHRLAIRAVYQRQISGVTDPPPTVSPVWQQHLSRLDSTYAETFSPQQTRHHAELAQRLSADIPAVVETQPLGEGRWQVTVIAYDYPGELSILCGLFFVYGFNIQQGDVFTYEPAPGEKAKIVDVFTVQSIFFEPPAESLWQAYTRDLFDLLRLFRSGQRREARGLLARRVGSAFQLLPGKNSPMLPIEIEIDNQDSARYTALRINAPDTVGFLYEFTNALALTRTNIARMIVRTEGSRAHDLLLVTDERGQKITDSARQRELRAAIVLIKHFTHLLPHSPNPEAALLHFREFLAQLFSRPNWPNELTSLQRPEVLDALARLLGVSDYLWDDFLRMQYANLYPVLRDVDALNSAKPLPQLREELNQTLQTCRLGEETYPNWRAALNAFKDRELFRIDMRHLLGLTAEFDDFSAELTDLADLLITAAVERLLAEAVSRCGQPLLADGSPCPLTVAALGKCGGREMGFASDIELMFLYSGPGQTSGPQTVENGQFYETLVQTFLETITARREGIFQIDLQLRPYGKNGPLAVSLPAFQRYYAPGGPAWEYERQALTRLRPLPVGGPAQAQQVVRLRDEFVFSGHFDQTAMRAMRERQVRHLVRGGTFNAKYSPGGLVDVEYLVQGLQMRWGAQYPSLRQPNTRLALAQLHQEGLLSEDDYTLLRKAHTFLRWLIDSLRVVRGNSKDITVPPPESEEFAFLARRLRYGDDLACLQQDLLTYPTQVQEIAARLWEASR